MYKNKILHYGLLFLLIFFSFSINGKGKGIYLEHLRCEMLNNPLGIDVEKPRFSWEIYGNKRGIIQKSYQIIVASSKEKLRKNASDIWNSGKVQTDQSVNVIYDGKDLQGRKKYFWKVKVWTNKGVSSWSQPHFWSMGILYQKNWHAKWIGLDRSFPWDSADDKFSRLSARYFRKEFKTQKAIRKATVYITGLGYYQLYINGQRIGKQVLTPNPTDYTKSVLYNTYDVTENMKDGVNAIGAILGNGLFFTMRQNYKTYKIRNFGYPKMLLQLEVQYQDGSKKTVISDGSWKVTADGPIRTNNIYDGSEYDARKELKGWSKEGYNDNNWLSVELVSPPDGKLMAQMDEKVKIKDTVQPVSIHYLRPGVYIMDMGQNMTGWLKMHVKGARGRKVSLRFAETLQLNGELATANLRDAKVTDVYTLKGDGEEIWQPSFTYHGFRYVEITNYPGKPLIEDFSGMVVYDDLRTTGHFHTSNELINKIYQNAFRGVLGNYKGIPVDCPQRNERMPWLGDRAVSSYSESFIFDNANLYEQCLNNIEQSQTEDGVIPDVAPAFWKYYTDDITWPSTYFQVADMLYHQYGEVRPIKKHYPSMKKWVNHIRKKYMEDYLIPKDKYGDWCMPPEHIELIHAKDPSRITNGTLLATAYYYHILVLMNKFAGLLNKPLDAKHYEQLAEKIRGAFNQEFLNRNTGAYDNNTVTANLLPLYFGITPDHYKDKVFKNMTHQIVSVYDKHISTGTLGTQMIMRGLTRFGRPDLAYSIVSTKTYPGWGYMVANGATTIWELWNGNKANQWMSSRNHVMLLGDLVVWLYEDVAGIRSDDENPGYKKIIMKPMITDSLQYVNASYHSIHGLIKSNWHKTNHSFHWNISIPGNTSAIVSIPSKSDQVIRENGENISKVKGVKLLGKEKGFVTLKVGSGNYSFKAVL